MVPPPAAPAVPPSARRASAVLATGAVVAALAACGGVSTTLPRDLFEAAMLGGASYWRVFRSIVVPLSVPALVIVFVFELRASWTDLVKPLIYLRDPALFTIPRGLKAVVDQFGQGGEAQWEVVLAASVVTTLPMVLLFLCCQRFFVEGIATTGRGGS